MMQTTISLFIAALSVSSVGGFVTTAPLVKTTTTTTTTSRRQRDDLKAATLEDAAATRKMMTETMPWPLNPEYGAFQQDRDWGFAYSTTNAEGSYTIVSDDSEGTVPSCLMGGTFYKIGPASFERGGRRFEHVLDGDGFVASFAFQEDGGVQYTGRFVETEYFLQEQKQDKILYRNVFGTQRSGGALANAFDITLKNVANTNVLPWGGRLLALWEAGKPYELHPDTLETLCPMKDEPMLAPFSEVRTDCRVRSITIDDGGPIDEMVKVGKSFTAHPHIITSDDGKKETLVAFTSTNKAKTDETVLEFVEYDEDWQPVKPNVQYVYADGMAPHDFSISNDYYCFFQNRFSIDTLPYILGFKSPTQVLQLLLREPTILHLVPRHTDDKEKPQKALRFEVPSYFNMHNVAEVKQVCDNKLVLYSNGWDLKDERFFPSNEESVPFLGSWGGSYPDFLAGIVPPTMLYRTVIDLENEKIESHEEVVRGLVLEFPISDAANPDRYVYGGASSTNHEPLPNVGVCKVDIQNDTAECWWAEHRTFAGEAISVAKRNGDKGSWVLTVLYDAAKKRSSLAILDSERFVEGPVARIHLRHHLTFGLHSSFAPATAKL